MMKLFVGPSRIPQACAFQKSRSRLFVTGTGCGRLWKKLGGGPRMLDVFFFPFPSGGCPSLSRSSRQGGAFDFLPDQSSPITIWTKPGDRRDVHRFFGDVSNAKKRGTSRLSPHSFAGWLTCPELAPASLTFSSCYFCRLNFHRNVTLALPGIRRVVFLEGSEQRYGSSDD
jgi:hypothetical protein